jgi:hypothetical protein
MREALRDAFRVTVRPFYGFGELKYEGKGSTGLAWVFLVLAAAAHLTLRIYSGLAFSTFNPRTFNLLRELAGMGLPFFLFVIGNWAVSTILDGEGSMKEIFRVCCYALIPYILASLLGALLSHVLTLKESFLISTLEGTGTLWALFLLFSGLTVMHQYTAGKTVAILMLTLVFMALALFIMILLASIADQLISYVSSIISEIKLRM